MEVLAGEGGGVDFVLQAVGVVEVVAAEGDEVGAQFHDEFVEGEAALVGIVGFGGDESFGADVLEVREEVGGLDFLDEEDAGVIGRGDELGDEGALVGRIGIGRQGTQEEEAQDERVGGTGDPTDVARYGAVQHGDGGDGKRDDGRHHVAALPCGVVVETEEERGPCAHSEGEVSGGAVVFRAAEGDEKRAEKKRRPREEHGPGIGIDGHAEKRSGVIFQRDETAGGVGRGHDGHAGEGKEEGLQGGEDKRDGDEHEGDGPALAALAEKKGERGDATEGQHFRTDEGEREDPQSADESGAPRAGGVTVLRFAPDPHGEGGGEDEGHAGFHGVHRGPVEDNGVEEDKDGKERGDGCAELRGAAPDVEAPPGEGNAEHGEDAGDGHEAFVGADLPGENAEDDEDPFPEDGGVGAGGLAEGILEPAAFGEVAREDEMDHDVAGELVGAPLPKVVAVRGDQDDGGDEGGSERE